MTQIRQLTGLAVAAALALPAGAEAQVVPGQVTYTVVIPAGEFGSPAYTSVLVKAIDEAIAFCVAIGNEAYNVDCLAERLGKIADEIPRDTDYDEVRSALSDTSKKLGQLARSNRDRTLPRGPATRPGPTPETTTRPLTPVRADVQTVVNAQARVIVAATQTKLLRSAEGSESKLSQYSRIAEALDSNKVLLRAG